MLTNAQKDAKSEALNSILRRISKLFALAERAGSVHGSPTVKSLNPGLPFGQIRI